MRSHVLGLYWFDAESGKSVPAALIRDATAEIVPPNQVVYKNAFNGLKADVQYIYAKGGFEQNIVLLERPQPPVDMNQDTVRLEVWTEFLQAPEPTIRATVLKSESNPERRAKMAEPDLVDETLDFGELWFPPGKAFGTASAENLPLGVPAEVRPPSGVDDVLPVAKRWIRSGNRTVLVESVVFQDLKPKLKRMKQASII